MYFLQRDMRGIVIEGNAEWICKKVGHIGILVFFSALILPN